MGLKSSDGLDGLVVAPSSTSAQPATEAARQGGLRRLAGRLLHQNGRPHTTSPSAKRCRALEVHIIAMGRRLGRGTTESGLVVAAIAKPELGTQPKPLGEASTPPGRRRLHQGRGELITTTPSPERSEGQIFPTNSLSSRPRKLSGPTNRLKLSKGAQGGRKAAPCTLRGEEQIDTLFLASKIEQRV